MKTPSARLALPSRRSRVLASFRWDADFACRGAPSSPAVVDASGNRGIDRLLPRHVYPHAQRLQEPPSRKRQRLNADHSESQGARQPGYDLMKVAVSVCGLACSGATALKSYRGSLIVNCGAQSHPIDFRRANPLRLFAMPPQSTPSGCRCVQQIIPSNTRGPVGKLLFDAWKISAQN